MAATPHDDQPISVTMPVHRWQLVDGTIDNTVATAIDDADADAAARGDQVRAAGWSASAAHPQTGAGWGGWPPGEDDITVTLPQSLWAIVVRELERWAVVSESMGQEHAEHLGIAAEVSAQLER